MNKSKNLIFFGTELFSLSSLRALVENRFTVVAVVTKPDRAKGRGNKLEASEVKKYALRGNIPVIEKMNIDALEEELSKYSPFAGVLSSFGKIVPPSILDLFEGGIINVHPSLLPEYRGASPIEQTILNGDGRTGVSLMKLVKKMDAGPIYAQEIVNLSGKETSPKLYETLASAGSKLLVNNLGQILSGELAPKQQDDNLASFAPMITKQDGVINWSQSAKTIERQIRAYISWPSSKTVIAHTQVAITEASTVAGSGTIGSMKVVADQIHVYCSEDVLVICRLKPAGKREMTAKEFLMGNHL